jgi:single-strand DNA-binding protein
MNDLNSVLIEGTVIKKDDLINKDGTLVCRFSIASNRYFRKDNCIEKEIFVINIEATSKLAENTYNMLYKGKNARIVGRLKRSNDNIVIEAEHIEFKPQYNIDNQEKLFFNGEDKE